MHFRMSYIPRDGLFCIQADQHKVNKSSKETVLVKVIVTMTKFLTFFSK